MRATSAPGSSPAGACGETCAWGARAALASSSSCWGAGRTSYASRLMLRRCRGAMLSDVILEAIKRNAPLASVVCPGGLPSRPGRPSRILTWPRVFARSRRRGRRLLQGKLAGAIVSEMATRGGASQRPTSRVTGHRARTGPGRYRGYDIVSAPPPVGGVTLAEILQILDVIDFSNEAPLSPRYVHVVAEALKRGFADFTANVGDPDFVNVPVAELLSADYARRRAPRSSPTRSLRRSRPARWRAGIAQHHVALRRRCPRQTCGAHADHLGLLRREGHHRGTGIILNNEMKNFGTRGPNAIAPGSACGR